MYNHIKFTTCTCTEKILKVYPTYSPLYLRHNYTQHVHVPVSSVNNYIHVHVHASPVHCTCILLHVQCTCKTTCNSHHSCLFRLTALQTTFPVAFECQ